MAMNMNGYDPEAEDPADPNTPPKTSTSPLVKYGMQSGNTGITGGQPTGNGTGVAPAAPAASTAPASPNVGHDGTYNGMNREQWRDQWMSSGQMSQDQMKQKLTEMGATPTGRGDTWTTPYGETYDLGIGYKTGNPTAGWTAVDGSGGSGGGSGAGGGAGGGTGGAGGSGGPGAGAGGDLWSFLMNQMNQSKQVSAQDPIIANQRNAFNAQTTRAGNEYLRQQAEQAGPQGNLAQERRMVAEKAGQAGGQFEAQLMQQELTARRQEIQQALSGALGYLTDQQKMALTRQLAEMDNALQYANLGQRGYEFDQNNLFRNSPLGS